MGDEIEHTRASWRDLVFAKPVATACEGIHFALEHSLCWKWVCFAAHCCWCCGRSCCCGCLCWSQGCCRCCFRCSFNLFLLPVAIVNNLVVAPAIERTAILCFKATIVAEFIFPDGVEKAVQSLLVPMLERLALEVLTAPQRAFEPVHVFKFCDVVGANKFRASSCFHLAFT